MQILIVEDDTRIRHYLEAVLSSSGYDVLEADSAQCALSMAASHNPELILLDLGLPDRDGQEIIGACAPGRTGPSWSSRRAGTSATR